MESVLWYLLAGTRGGPNRIRMLRALENHPQNANQLADGLNLDYTTVRYHLELLLDHGLVDNSGDKYGSIYHHSEKAKQNWETIETVIRRIQAEQETDTSDQNPNRSDSK
jgi:DNA-binding transcriptional ArsR family regulator